MTNRSAYVPMAFASSAGSWSGLRQGKFTLTNCRLPAVVSAEVELRLTDGKKSCAHGWNSPDTPMIQTWRRSFAGFAGNDCGSRSATSYLTKTLRPPASGGFIKASIQAFGLS